MGIITSKQMVSFDQNEFILFIFFVIPGMIAIKTYGLITPSSVNTSKQIIDAITYSCFNYAVLLWPIYSLFHKTLNINKIYDLYDSYPLRFLKAFNIRQQSYLFSRDLLIPFLAGVSPGTE